MLLSSVQLTTFNQLLVFLDKPVSHTLWQIHGLLGEKMHKEPKGHPIHLCRCKSLPGLWVKDPNCTSAATLIWSPFRPIASSKAATMSLPTWHHNKMKGLTNVPNLHVHVHTAHCKMPSCWHFIHADQSSLQNQENSKCEGDRTEGRVWWCC
jgi:hypothetical protein